MIQKIFSLTLLLGFLTSCSNRTNQDKDAVKVAYMHRYGVQVANEDEWKELGVSGKIVKQLKNGQTSITSWHEGTLHGPSSMSYPFTDILQTESLYTNGNCEWTLTHYASGVPERKEQYAPNNSIIVSSWYEDGILRSKEEYQEMLLLNGEYFTNEQEEESKVSDKKGERLVRDGYGTLLSRQVVQDGRIVEETKMHANGMPQAVIPYVNGKIEGIVKTYHITGEPKTIEEWQEGALNGEMTFFSNGEIVSVAPYIDGKREGIQENYRLGTKAVVEKISWKHDKRHGPTLRFIENQKITDWYFNDEKVSKMQFIELEAASSTPSMS